MHCYSWLLFLILMTNSHGNWIEDSSEHGDPPIKGPKGTTCPCGTANRVYPVMINGTETTEGKFPFMANLRDKEGFQYCTASIITCLHILTAAHCVSDPKERNEPVPSDIIAAVGTHIFMGDASHGESQKIQVHSVHVSPFWYKVGAAVSEGDLAVLLLKNPIKFSRWVSPVCLFPDPPNIVGKHIKAIGWGITEDGMPQAPREGMMKVREPEFCGKDEKILCFETGASVSCIGDSGGPYVYLDPETNRYTQVAVVSSGRPGCQGRNFWGVNINFYFAWVKRVIEGAMHYYNVTYLPCYLNSKFLS